MKIGYDQGLNNVDVVIQQNDAITYFTCGRISRPFMLKLENPMEPP